MRRLFDFCRHLQDRFAPKSLAAQLLCVMLLSAVVPLLLIGWLTNESTRNHFDTYTKMQTGLVERDYVTIYQSYLQEQIYAIDAEMRKVEHAVITARSQAKAILDDGALYPGRPLALTSLGNGAYVEDHGRWAIKLTKEPSSAFPRSMLRDLALSTYLNPFFAGELDRNPNMIAMYYMHPLGGTLYYGSQSGYGRLFNGEGPITGYAFYRDALQISSSEDRVAWTKPYWDITPNGRVFTATAPIYDSSGTLRGVVAADVTVDDFVAHVLGAHFKSSDAFAFLLGADHQMMAVQRQGAAVIGQLDPEEFIALAEGNGYGQAVLDGQTKMLFAKKVPATGWYLGYVLPKERLLAGVTRSSSELAASTSKHLFHQLTLISIISFLLCTALAVLLWLRISRPLKRLDGAFHDMGNGQFRFTLKDTRIREVHRLLQSFNLMSARIGELMEQQTKLQEELEHKVEERTLALQQVNDELRQRIDELTRLGNWRKKWFSHISHDLKTPATIAGGFIEAIIDGKVQPAHIPRYLDKISDRLWTINQLVQNLYDLSLLETRQTRLKPETMPVYALLERLLAKWNDPLVLKGRTLNYELPMIMDTPVTADVHYLGRAVDNVLDNAVKYSHPGSAITIQARMAPRSLLLHVSDCGIGIPSESLKHVFDSFYRVDPARNSGVPGSGLGLAIAREVLHMHGGEIHASLNENPGCTFTIEIPLEEVEPDVSQISKAPVRRNA